MKTQLITIFVSAAVTGSALAAPESFDFKDPKNVNVAVFRLDAPLEAVNGSANGISGTVTFDPQNPAATTGKIVVASQSLMVPNPMQNTHMHSDKWLDTAQFPEIAFEEKQLKNVHTDGDVTTADAVGTFTLKGVSKDITVPIKLTYLKDKLSARVPKMEGDLLVIRANFAINRSDYNIMPGKLEEKVSEEIDLTLSIAGAAPK